MRIILTGLGLAVLVIAAFVFWISIMVTYAHADTASCAPYADVAAKLASSFGEVPVGMGVSEDGQTAYELLADPKDGSFTWLRVSRDGTACMMTGGVGWQFQTKGDPA